MLELFWNHDEASHAAIDFKGDQISSKECVWECRQKYSQTQQKVDAGRSRLLGRSLGI